MSATRKAYKQLGSMVSAFVALLIILALLQVPTSLINLVTGWFASAFIGVVTSFFATAIVEEVTGDWLKPYLIEFTIFGFEFSVSLFFIATIVVRIWLFH